MTVEAEVGHFQECLLYTFAAKANANTVTAMASNASVFRHQRVLFLTFAQGQNVGSAGPRSSPLPVLRSGEIHLIGTAAHINANDVPGTRIVRATEGTNKEEVGGTSSYVEC